MTMEAEKMFNAARLKNRIFRRPVPAALMAMIIITALSLPAFSKDVGQKAFKSPRAAFKALVEAAKDNDTKEMMAIFGPEGKDIISSGDAVADTRARERFVAAASEKVKFSKMDDNSMLAVIGKDRWCFPIPIVKSGQKWVFNTEDGKQEIINRRIGRNELNTVQVALAYVNAQREYDSRDRTGDGPQYAEHFLSQPGKKDGLYWEAKPGEERSPLGPLFARATEEGYTFKKGSGKHSPYYGYYFRILKSQGPDATGGARDYVVNGKMTGGFGLVAYPAQYGISGVMTFIVNQDGIVHEKDLGPKTEEAAKEIKAYDPDKTWIKVEPAGAVKAAGK